MRRPWNIVNQPVYSLATYKDGKLNMNVATYVTSISMKPKQYAIAVSTNSKTLENLKETEVAVLQLLSKDNIDLIKTIGKKSGLTYNKEAYLSTKKLLTNWLDYTVLKDTCAVIELKKIAKKNTKGDHELFIFECGKAKTYAEDNILMFQDLVSAKIIL